MWTKENKCSLTVFLSLPFWRNSVYLWFRTAGDRLMNISVLAERCQIKIVIHYLIYHTCIIPVSAWGRRQLIDGSYLYSYTCSPRVTVPCYDRWDLNRLNLPAASSSLPFLQPGTFLSNLISFTSIIIQKVLFKVYRL